MSAIKKILGALVLLAVSFGAGYLYGVLPLGRELGSSRADLEAARTELQKAAKRLALQSLGAQLGRVYFELQQNNFGVASEKVTPVFDSVQELLKSSPPLEERERAALQEILASRDQIVAELAKPSPEIKKRVGELYTGVLALLGT